VRGEFDPPAERKPDGRIGAAVGCCSLDRGSSPKDVEGGYGKLKNDAIISAIHAADQH